MSELHFYKKKKMMAKRDALLEEIGQAAFEEGNLPKNFEDLPREFRGLDALLGQIRDRRLAQLRDYDRVEEKFSNQQKELINFETAHAVKLKPLRKERDEAAVKVRHLKDRSRLVQRPKQLEKLADLEKRLAALEEEIKILEKAQQLEIDALNQEIEPVALRREKLSRGIHNLEEEQSRLKTTRQRRLRDLGHHYYEKRIDEANFGVKYGQLKILKMELGRSRQEHLAEDFSPVRKASESNWNWIWVVILASVLMGYLYRTQFREEEVNLKALSAPFLEDGEWSLFANLATVDRLSVSPYLPNLNALPGGTAFREVSTDDIVAVALNGETLQNPNFLGVVLRAPPGRFANRLRQQGWRHQKVPGDWLALSKDDWVWVMLNPRQFLFFPIEQLSLLEDDHTEPTRGDLFLRGRWQPFDNNRPLLGGGQHFELHLQDQTFSVNVPFDPLPHDFGQRRKFLDNRLLMERSGPMPSFDDRGFVLTGDREKFAPATYQAQDLRKYLEETIDTILQESDSSIFLPPVQNEMDESLKTQLDFSQALPAAEPLHDQGKYHLNILAHGKSQVRLLQSLALPGPPTGVTYLERGNGILLASRGSIEVPAALTFMPLRQGNVDSQYVLRFDESSSGLMGFQPEFMTVSPDETVVILAGSRLGQRRPLLVMISLSDFQVLWREELPNTVRGILSAVWHEDSGRVYLGCLASERRNQTAIAVLDFQHTGNILQLSRLIDLPVAGLGTILITDVLLEKETGELLVWQVPRRRIVHLGSERMDDNVFRNFVPANFMDVGNAVADTSLLLPTRDPKQLLIAMHYVGELGDDRGFFMLVEAGDTMAFKRVHQLDAPPRKVLRVPLSDRYWVALASEPKLVRIRLFKDQIALDLQPPPLRIYPEFMAMDTLGDFLFVAGEKQE